MLIIIGALWGIVLGYLLWKARIRLYNYLNKVEVERITKHEHWVTYHVNEGPQGIRALYKRSLSIGIEDTDFIDENGNPVAPLKWVLLNAAVNKFKMNNDLK